MKTVDWKTQLNPYLTENIQKLLMQIDPSLPVEELRIRLNKPLQLFFSGGERVLRREGGAAAVTEKDCASILQKLCAQSLYAWEEELKRGYVTLPGGCRVGLSGAMSASRGGFAAGDVTGFNFRIARDIPGAADLVLPCITVNAQVQSALILSPPGYGKTTVLRDIARQASCGTGGLSPCRVCVVDTRYELAGSVAGAPQMELGTRTDVLSGVPKAEGMRMMILNMAPDLLITDELSTAAEAEAALEARSCGVTLIASAHGESLEGLLTRPTLAALCKERVFSRYVLLSCKRGHVAAVYDVECRRVWMGEKLCTAS